jgi:hypothetical protein
MEDGLDTADHAGNIFMLSTLTSDPVALLQYPSFNLTQHNHNFYDLFHRKDI